MKIHHHLDDATLMSFAAGNLPEAISAVVSAHLSWCEECRNKVRELEMIGGSLLNNVDPVELEAGTRDHLEEQFELIMQDQAFSEGEDEVKHELEDMHSHISCDVLPPSITQFIGKPYSEIKWKFLSPGIQSYKIPLSHDASGDLRLIKIAPGCSLPEHGHNGAELTLVLSGSYKDEHGHYKRGDVADLDHEAEHEPVVVSDQECICLFASEKPVKFKGLVPRLLQPIIGV